MRQTLLISLISNNLKIFNNFVKNIAMKNKHLKNIIIIFAISIVITFIFDFASGGTFSNLPELFLNILYGALIGGSLSLTGTVTRVVLKKSDITKKPVKTYTLLLIIVTLFITADVFTINSLWFYFTQDISLYYLFTNTGFILSSIITIFIGLTIFFIILSKGYITRLNDANEKMNKIKQEADKSKFETLKSQINPHFLFNSLNTLSSLIYIDANKADEFTNKLSKIYRYILDNQDDELTTVNDEIEFINKYIYLQKIRFDNNFEVQIADYSIYKEMMIVPLSLQILLENVFKHNIISDNIKIKISINFEQNYIIVENNKTPKKDEQISHNVGINNIINRYKLICDKECIIENKEDIFKVKLPLIENK